MSQKNLSSSTPKKRRPKKERGHCSAPIAMTQEEVEALAASDVAVQRQIARRLRTAVPSKVPLRASGEQAYAKATPARISRAEMEAITRLGRAPEELLNRLTQQAAKYEPRAKGVEETLKTEPGRPPPGQSGAS
jgi:hypothetical protein